MFSGGLGGLGGLSRFADMLWLIEFISIKFNYKIMVYVKLFRYNIKNSISS